MTKDSKSQSTIRRRKGKQVALALQKIKEETPKQIIGFDEQIAALEADEKCYLFDDRVFGPVMLRRLMFSSRSLFLALFSIRVANALLIQTQYVPDEYWQSLEVAHKMVFGYGYMTWEWREGLRGYSYPLLFAFFFKILNLLGLDSRTVLIKVPRLVQGFIAAYGDLQLYKLSSKLSGRATAQWTLLCHLLSWFTIYCCTRTLSNSTETTLVIAALSYFPWPDHPSQPKDVYKFLILAALSVIVRPTAAVIWILLCSWHLQRMHGSPLFSNVVKNYFFVGFLMLGISVVIDRVWYGRWVFVQLNFLLFNVVHGGASIYGVHPWHWYFFQGFPVILGTFIFPFLLGAWRSKNKGLLWIILWILATHSFLPHKEFRFILMALPLAMHYCGVYFQTLCCQPPLKKFKPKKESSRKQAEPDDNKSQQSCESIQEEDVGDEVKAATTTQVAGEPAGSKSQSSSSGDHLQASSSGDHLQASSSGDRLPATGSPTQADSEEAKNSFQNRRAKLQSSGTLEEDEDSKVTVDPEVLRDAQHKRNLAKAKVFVVLLGVTNLLPAMYFCLIHQRGTIMATKYLHDASLKHPDMDVLFLMPCHSTPYYSYVHQNISMRFLKCEPNLLGVSNYTEEAEFFYQDPKHWLQKEYVKRKRPWPTHIVYFSSLLNDISGLLTQAGYRLCEQFFHTHVPEGRVGGSVLVSCR